VEGPDDGPLAIILHGFPDCRSSFNQLARTLAATGYRVARPAMRGYPPSSISSTGNYQSTALAFDPVQIHEQLGGDARSVLIGHDWGAAATYLAIAAAPQRWRKAVTMAVPPPAVFGQLFMNYEQLQRSWYMWFFQLPIAEMAVGIDNNAFIEKLWNDWSPNLKDHTVCDEVRELLSAPEHLAAALGYYRHLFDGHLMDERHQFIFDARFSPPTVPTLFIHGLGDGCIAGLDAGVAAHLAPGSRAEFLDGVGHFMQLELPDKIDQLVVEWLAD
jgi:pimeloyl-ACP methyl ester carboxylesterase